MLRGVRLLIVREILTVAFLFQIWHHFSDITHKTGYCKRYFFFILKYPDRPTVHPMRNGNRRNGTGTAVLN